MLNTRFESMEFLASEHIGAEMARNAGELRYFVVLSGQPTGPKYGHLTGCSPISFDGQGREKLPKALFGTQRSRFKSGQPDSKAPVQAPGAAGRVTGLTGGPESAPVGPAGDRDCLHQRRSARARSSNCTCCSLPCSPEKRASRRHRKCPWSRWPRRSSLVPLPLGSLQPGKDSSRALEWRPPGN